MGFQREGGTRHWCGGWDRPSSSTTEPDYLNERLSTDYILSREKASMIGRKGFTQALCVILLAGGTGAGYGSNQSICH